MQRLSGAADAVAEMKQYSPDAMGYVLDYLDTVADNPRLRDLIAAELRGRGLVP